MISSIQLKDFKSYAEAELKLSPLTVLIGANASGKSNALEAIRLLSWLAQGEKLGSLQYQVNHTDQVVRGAISDLARKGLSKFTIGGKIKGPEYDKVSLSISFRDKEGLHIDKEICYKHIYDFLYQTVRSSTGSGTDVQVEYNNRLRGRHPQITCTDQRAIFTQLDNPGLFREGYKWSRKTIPSTTVAFEKSFANILFLDPVPSLMREYSYPTEYSLSENGSNLSSVLHFLLNVARDKEANKSYVLEFISSLPEQDISEVNFLVEPKQRVMLTLVETFGKESREVDAGLLSDGTLRVLAIAAALLSAAPGSMVVIEEIDNGVHPSRVGRLLKAVEETARRRGLNILISSHNPALLDALSNQAIPDVVLCYRDKTDGWSKLLRLGDVPDYPEIIAQGTLGDLVTEGSLERFVKEYQGSSAKKERALEWLNSMKKTA